jgi:hypothetical protein
MSGCEFASAVLADVARILATALAGMVGGIAVATRLLSSSVEGIDQLASALAGFVIGGLAGLVAGIVLSRCHAAQARARRDSHVLAAVVTMVLRPRLAGDQIGPLSGRRRCSPDRSGSPPIFWLTFSIVERLL